MASSVGKITYEIQSVEGTYQIDVPADWKVTFGPVAVGATNKRGYGDSSGSMALRFYESDTKQRAIFTGVHSFRDVSIPLRRKIKNVTEEHAGSTKRGPKGSTSDHYEVVKVDEQWEPVQ